MRWPRGVRSRRAAAVGVGCVLLAMCVQVWPGPSGGAGGYDPFGLQRSSTPPGPVLITAVGTGLIWRAGVVPSTAITVHDATAQHAGCLVWWILSRRGDPTPWDDPLEQSLPVPVTLAPFESQTVAVNRLALSSSTPGIFSLSAWVHCRYRATGAWMLSDGATMGGSVEVLPTSSTLEHSSAGSRLYWIEAASIHRLRGGRPGRIRVSIANGWVEPVMVQVVCSLSAVDLVLPDAGRGSTAAARSLTARTEINLAAVGLTTVDLAIPRLPAPGRYVLTIVISLQRATASVAVDSVRVEPRVVVNA